MNRINLIVLAFLCAFSGIAIAQDTSYVTTLTYGSTTRDTVIDFPDESESYEKILMLYNMRCKDNLVSDASNRNKGCGEWDYSCNTYIVDSTKSDSLLSSTSDYSISNFSGATFNYKTAAMYDYYRNRLQNVTVTNTANETSAVVGIGIDLKTYMLPNTSNPSAGNAGKVLHMFTASELLTAGFSAGEIDAISFESLNGGTSLNNLVVGIKSTSKDSLNYEELEYNGFTSVFSNTINFSIGVNKLQFHTPFVWDGISNIILSFSANDDQGFNPVNLRCHASDTTRSIYAQGGYAMFFDGSTYVETDNYKGIQGSAARTIDAWIKTETANGEICSWGTDRSGEKWVFRINDNGTIRVEVNGGNIYGTTNVLDNKWHHVACVLDGNKVSNIKLYVDGELETNGNVTDLNINTTNNYNVRISRGVNNRYFAGNIDEVRIWNKALSAAEIKSIQRQASVGLDTRIEMYYRFNDQNGNRVNDFFLGGDSATIIGTPRYTSYRGGMLFKDFVTSDFRPNLTFYQGDYTFTIDTNDVLDGIEHIPHTVIHYEILAKPNSIVDDEKVILSSNVYWNADVEQKYFDEDGAEYQSESVTADGSVTPQSISYYRRWPSALEIMSFVTPYGIGLDLGPNGKTWTFDVTDFAPVLKGTKRMFMSRGGQNQEQMDIQFVFIKGTPAREVIDISQIWPTAYFTANYSQIADNSIYYPTVDVVLPQNGKEYKLRSAITGHGQEGEFIPRQHFLTVDTDTTLTRTVWKECAYNPIYPQGGTWIYDRAGWCPGMATDLIEYDITKFVEDGKVQLDYGIIGGSGDSRYIVNNQLVTYGAKNFTLDAAVVDITSPTNKIEYGRTNPACVSPKVIIRNDGSDVLYSVKLNYWVNDKANAKTAYWEGYLRFSEEVEYHLPIDNSVWTTATATNNVFHVEIVEANGVTDEYANNNVYSSAFEKPEVYPQDIYFFYRMNSAANENSFSVKDDWGNVIFERNAMEANKIYRDTVRLGIGCHQLLLDDSDDDGISFWANSDGNGFFRIMEVGGGVLKTLEGDFGGSSILNFTVLHALDVPEVENKYGYQCYPNPTRGLLTVTGYDLRETKSQVFNSFGQELSLQPNISDTQITYDLANEASGMYLVRMEKNGEVWVSKVIVE